MRGCEAIAVELPGYAGRKLEASATLSVQRHLEACTSCQGELREIERLEQLLAVGLPSISPSPTFASSFANRLAAEIADESSEREWFSARALASWLFQPWLIPVMAAALLAAVMFSPWFSEQSSAPGFIGTVAQGNKLSVDANGSPKGTEKSALAVANPPPDVIKRPELFVDYAVIRDLDILDSEGQANAG